MSKRIRPTRRRLGSRRQLLVESLESRIVFDGDFPADANVIDVAAIYGAVPGDGIDDTAAVQLAITDYVSRNAILYFRNGVYNFSAPLDYSPAGRGESGLWLQGQSKTGTIFRWGNNLPVFNQVDTLGATINVVALDTYNGNNGNAFGNYLHDFTVEIGAGNPGAIGIQYQTNNYGSLGDVTIRSLDPQKIGARGLDIIFAEPGPMLLTNLTVDGFNQGILAGPQTYSAVFEGLTLTNQREFGFGNYRLPVSINNFTSVNSVPAYVHISSFGWGNTVITNANLSGGGLGNYAIVNEASNSNGQGAAGNLTLRNVNVSGYTGAVDDQVTGQRLAGPLVTEHITFTPFSLVPGSPVQTLNLPIEQTPTLPADPAANWVSVVSFGANPYDDRDDTEAIQRALDSGAKTIYFPNPTRVNRTTGQVQSGSYRVERTLTVGGNVQRVAGLYSTILVLAPLYGTEAALFSVVDGPRDIVQIDSFVLGNEGGNQGGSWYAFGHDTLDTLVIKDVAGSGYRNSVRGGRVYIEAISGTDYQFSGQQAWLRQFNPEGTSDAPKLLNDGGDVWVLGLKTEGRSTQVETINGGRTEILGGNFYHVHYIPASLPAFNTVDSSLSFSAAETNFIYSGLHNTWVRDTRNGVTRELTRANSAINGSRLGAANIGLYTDRIVDATGPSTPSNLSGTTTLNSVTLTWNAAIEYDSFVRAYRVYRNGEFIGATKGTSTSFIDARRPDGVAGSYQVVAENAAGVRSNFSAARILTTIADRAAPQISNAGTTPYSSRVTVFFNEPIRAVNVANFAIDNGVTVTSATLAADRKSVALVTSPLSSGVQYTVTVNGISDLANIANTLPAGTAATFTHRNSAGGTGLTGSYYATNNFTGAPVVRLDPTVDFSWSGSPGLAGIGADNFSVRWTGQIEPKFSETYRFTMVGDDGIRLAINGSILINRTNYSPDEISGTITLEAGKRYEIDVSMFEFGGGAGARLWWESVSQTREIVPASQLISTAGNIQNVTVRTGVGLGADAGYQIADGGVQADYYANNNLSGQPVLTRTENGISSFFGSGSPGGGVPNDNFSVRYTGFVLPAFTENYIFTAIADDRVRLYINDQLILSRNFYSPDPFDSAPVPLIAGVPASIRFEVEEDFGDATAFLLWRSNRTVQDSPKYLPSTFQDNGASGTLTTYNRQNLSFFAEFIGLRFDLAGVDLTQNRIVDSRLLATLAGGTGDEVALITVDGLDDQVAGQTWDETGPNRRRFATFPGNHGGNYAFGGPRDSTHLGYAILDNTNFRTNAAGQDGIQFSSPGLTEFVQSDTDRLVTLMIRRTVPTFFGNINIFTKENGNANIAPGLQLTLAPKTTTAPLAVDLLPGSDTGSSNSDDRTTRNNSSPNQSLRFRVDGTTVGNLITLYSDGVAIGSAIATATSTEILTNGAERLASGARSITGRQTFLGVESVNSPALMVSINATIEGRQVFYNNATGANLSSVGVAQNAIDTSKFALRPEQSSTFSNYTNYSRGLNGVIIDIGNLPTTTTNAQMLASLQFAQWNGIAANGFTALPVAAIPTVAVLGGSGTGGSARVKITFPDNTLQNTWLRVTVVSNTQTALAADDVFYFGNVVGDFDTGNTATRLRVNGQDIQQILSNQSPGNNSAVVTNIYDVNRDGRVNGQDRIVLLSNQQAGGIVAPITVPLASVPASVPGTDGDKFSLTLTAAPAVQVGSAKVAKIAKDQDAIQMNATTTSNTRPAVAASSNITEPTAVVSAAPSLIIEESRDKALSKLNRLDEFFASLGVSNAL